jgi:CRP-like cAMP-binding protein
MEVSPLLTQLKQVYKVPDRDCARLVQLFEPLEVKKNEHLFQSGQVARHVYFIEKGCLRQYKGTAGYEFYVEEKAGGGHC